ncbi:molybdate ABC transporter substrate-binding protein [Corynebacterium tapiri]|uniref:Molybdate ABC transporter substrate-binding protein n=1 Tax=Corynebacterium tapiri TaxID=1448266 RepID=A0A5C4U5Q5_9CORY|nr:molybdate ABC transporter substrate-binding protein [Corynebacterium tapiri]TNL99719.1 molybdate ABC transporter substrate-binding protein [Corynebacterium tapiri]
MGNESRRLRRHLAGLSAASGLLAASCAPPITGDQSPSATLFAASSTRVVNEELTSLASDAGVELRINTNGSSGLISQLSEGAQATALITADGATMKKALDQGLVVAPQAIARNTLVMVVPADNPAGITSIRDLTEQTRLVLCDDRVPCGAASSSLAQVNGLKLSPVSLEAAVGDVLGKVVNGQADAGWVYRTDAVAAGDSVRVIEIDQSERFPTTLWAAPTKQAAGGNDAQALMNILQSPAFAADLASAGFLPLDAGVAQL